MRILNSQLGAKLPTWVHQKYCTDIPLGNDVLAFSVDEFKVNHPTEWKELLRLIEIWVQDYDYLSHDEVRLSFGWSVERNPDHSYFFVREDGLIFWWYHDDVTGPGSMFFVPYGLRENLSGWIASFDDITLWEGERRSMKIKLWFKTPDAVHYAIEEEIDALQEIAIDNGERMSVERQEELRAELTQKLEKWIFSGENVQIEFDLREMTATVLERDR